MATIEIDGKTFEVENGKMIIEVADEAGIYIPRFCYHKKLSVAANCRMCLVEVENSRKPVPACATPITNGMKVFTRSEEALRSQKAVMEFLLINHPLDCPICDQGGECELQDLAMGFGSSNSEYGESKRAIKDDNLGPLIATDMTRCIYCTRCVRFGTEIAGLREIGSIGRGENTHISTFIKHSLSSEVSANVIDLCPVGALTSKPFRFRARPWELTQYDSIAPHDCLGSAVHLHVRRNELMRVVPKENEEINENWLSDRDRFSYLGLMSEFRASKPKIKKNGIWETVSWETALDFVASGIQAVIKQHGPTQFAAFASPSSTLEEFYLLQKLFRALKVNNLDYRIQQTDFRDAALGADAPSSSLKYACLEEQNSILLLGCNIDREVPLAGLRLRKAAKNGAHLFAINPVDYHYPFNISAKLIVAPQELPIQLAKIVLSMAKDVNKLPKELQKLLVGLKVDDITLTMAQGLSQPFSTIVTGAICENHPDAALIRTMLYWIQELSDVRILRLTSGANSIGASLAGMLPHRGPAAIPVENVGMDVQSALNAQLKGYFLLGTEPEFDFANPFAARLAMVNAEFVVSLSAFTDSIPDYADAILPIAPYAETSGTYINIDRTWQTVEGVKAPHFEARPAWKIIRVLANLLQCKGFDYLSSKDVLDELRLLLTNVPEKKYQPYYPVSLPLTNKELIRIGEWPLYRCDMIVRHATALQESGASETACIKINPLTAKELNLKDLATVSQGHIEITLPLKHDARIAPNTIWVANAFFETMNLGHSFSSINIKGL